MPQPIKIPFPRKGVVRNYQRSEQGAGQPLPESTWNAQNILPYDRFERLRGGQRPGTLKLQTAISSSPIMLLASVSTALDPSTLPQITQINDNFVYSNGRLDTVASANWTASEGSNIDTMLQANPGFTGSANLVINTNKLQNQSINTTAGQAITSFTLGTNYTVSMTVQTVNSGDVFGLFFRRNPANASPNKYIRLMFVNNNTANSLAFVDDTGATITGNNPGFLAAGSHTLKLTVVGNVLTCFLDGVQQFQTTSTNASGGTGLGLYIGNNNASFRVTNFTVTTVKPQAVYRQNNLVAVTAGNVFEGDSSGVAQVTGGGAQLDSSVKPGYAYGDGFMYFVDGTANIRKLNLGTKAMVTYTATAGTAPTNCTIAAIYRDRLCLSGQNATPQAFYFSRVGTHTDWDYSQTDPAAAFAGSASTAGRVGEPVTALMPFNDDSMLIGGDHTLHIIRGDPADGGSIDLVSDAIGVYGPFAWTKNPQGEIFFIGNGGLYKIVPGGQPQLLTDQTWNLFFQQLDRAANYISLVWDRDRHGCYLFITPVTSATATHLFYDNRNGGLWPIQYPNTHGPVSAVMYDGDAGTSREVMLGGRAGLIQVIGNQWLDDDGTAISSLLSLGPIQPNTPTGDALVTGLDVTLGENASPDATSVINVNWTLRGGKSAYEVTEGTERRKVGGTFTYPGRQLTRRTRLRGGWFALEFSNSTLDTYFSVDQVVLHVEGQGKQR